jgi:hypothetical protein
MILFQCTIEYINTKKCNLIRTLPLIVAHRILIYRRFKLAREAKHAASESAALAEQERLEKLEEEEDAAAEAAAVAAGKITTADLEVPPPVWPFNQYYK